MNKYFAVFRLAWQNEFVYRVNFLLWRSRNIVRFLMTYFLWSGIFSTNSLVYGYSQQVMTTYIFMVLIVGTLIIASPSSDSIGGEISTGDLSNYLVKPIGYLKFWFARDLASKLLNVLFAIFELSVAWFLLRPTLWIPTNPLTIIAFILSVSIGIGLYYLLNTLSRFLTFWSPENSFGLSFLLLVFVEILSGWIFPLDILPAWLFKTLQLTPFPYLMYFPIAIISGKIVGFEIVRIICQSALWLGIIYLVNKYIWGKGLVVYQSNGR